MDENESYPSKNPYDVLILLACLLIPLALSYFFFIHQSLRLDEAQSLWQTSRSFKEIFAEVAGDVHVPLYHILLHLWRLYVSDSIASARVLSLVFFLASILALFKLAELMYDRTIALVSAFIFSISPFMNWYGNEIRMYTLFTFFVIVNQYFFVRIYKDKHSSSHIWAGYALTALAGIFSHYFFFLNIIAQGVFFLIRRKSFPKEAYKGFLLSLCLVAVSIAFWSWYVLHIGTATFQEPVIPRPTSVNLFNAFSQFLFGFQTDNINTIILSLWPLAIIAAFSTLRRNVSLSLNSEYLIITILVSFALAFGASFVITPIFVSRYLIFTIPSLYILIASFLKTIPKSSQVFARVAVSALMVILLLVEIIKPTTPVKENYAEAVDYISSHVSMQDAVVLSAPFTIYPVEYYYRGAAPLTTLPIWNQYNFGPIPAFNGDTLAVDATKVIGKSQNAYLLLSYDQGYEKSIKNYFDSHYKLIGSQSFSSDLNLYIYQIRYDTNTSAVALTK